MLRKIRETHDKCFNHLLLYLIESLSISFSPNKLPLFHAVSDGEHDDTKPLDESVIKGSEPMKASNFMDIFGLGPLHNHLNLLRVGRNSLRGYYET